MGEPTSDPNANVRRVVITDEIREFMTKPARIDFGPAQKIDLQLPPRLRLSLFPFASPMLRAPGPNPFQLPSPTVGQGLPWKTPTLNRFDADPEPREGKPEDLLNAIAGTDAAKKALESVKEIAARDAKKLFDELKKAPKDGIVVLLPWVVSIGFTGAVLAPRFWGSLPPLKGIPTPFKGLTMDLSYATPSKDLTGGVENPAIKEYRAMFFFDITTLIPSAK
jgi:hypothetical protein